MTLTRSRRGVVAPVLSASATRPLTSRAPIAIALALAALVLAGPATASSPVERAVNDEIHDFNRVHTATAATPASAEHIDGLAISQKVGGGS